MSRATTIWVILDASKAVHAAFTVRHEMVSWLGQQSDLTGWEALRVPDNPSRHLVKPIARFHAADLLPLGGNDRL